jgi:hypothetical protein
MRIDLHDLRNQLERMYALENQLKKASIMQSRQLVESYVAMNRKYLASVAEALYQLSIKKEDKEQ